MKTRKIEKALVLNKSTVAHLESNEMNNAQGGILPTGCIVTNCCKSEQKKCVVSVLFCQATINCQKDSIDAVSFCYA